VVVPLARFLCPGVSGIAPSDIFSRQKSEAGEDVDRFRIQAIIVAQPKRFYARNSLYPPLGVELRAALILFLALGGAVSRLGFER
jgi:hypothetical protein